MRFPLKAIWAKVRLPGEKKINLGNKAAMGAADKEEKEEKWNCAGTEKGGKGGNKRDGFVRRGGGQKKKYLRCSLS